MRPKNSNNFIKEKSLFRKEIFLLILLLLPFVIGDILPESVIIEPHYNYAVINWTTTENITGFITYGNVIMNAEPIFDSSFTKQHSITLNNLYPESKYIFRLKSGDSYYPDINSTRNFTTLTGGNVNGENPVYTLDAFSRRVNTYNITINGTTVPGSSIKILKKLDNIYFEQLMAVDGDDLYSYAVGPSGRFSIKFGLLEGNNDFKFQVLDPISYDLRFEEFSILADFTPPSVVIKPFDLVTKSLKLVGFVEENTSFTVYDNNTVSTTINLMDATNKTILGVEKPLYPHKYFNQSIVLSDGPHLVKFEIKDSIGNIREISNEMYFDNERPELFNITLLAGVTLEQISAARSSDKYYTPYNPVKISGEVTDNYGKDITILMFNNGDNGSYSWESNIDEENFGFTGGVTAALSLWGSVLGTKGGKSIVDNGEWDVSIGLQSPDRLKNDTHKDNYVWIRAVDKAGNIADTKIIVDYEPTSVIWGVRFPEVDPNEVMSAWLRHNDYSASLTFDLLWKDPRDFSKAKLLDINVHEVDNGEDLLGSGLISNVEDSGIMFVKDESLPGYKVFINFMINQDMNANKLLEGRKEIKFNFKLDLAYNYDNVAQQTEKEFVQATFSAETPYDLSDFLTTNLVNNTLIPLVNQTKNILEKIANTTMDPVLSYTLPSCIALQLGVTVSSFIGSGSSALLQPMKYVCDRVYCPAVPPKGPDLTKITGSSLTKGQNINAAQLDAAGWGGYKTSFGNPPVPCNPVTINNAGGATTSLMSSATTNPVQTGEQLAVYQVKELAWGTATNRCYSDVSPFYDNAKCLIGGNNNIYDLNPMTDIVDAFQCGCFSGIYLQTTRYARMMQSVLDCLNSVEEGLYDAGYCEQILSSISCEAVQYVFEGVLDGAFDKRGDTFGSQNTVGKLTMQDMEASYGKAMSDMFGEQGAGSVVKKACMLALGMDVADFSTMLSQAISAADNKPTVGPVWVQSQVDTFNPITSSLNIQYKFGTYVMAGLGSDVTFEVVLVCDPKIEHPYCDPQIAEKVIYTANVLKGTTHKETIVKSDIGATQWYNAAFIRYSYQDSGSRTTVEKAKEYMPNDDCNQKGGIPNSIGCSGAPTSGITCCEYARTVISTTEETKKDKTENKKIITRGGMTKECYLSAAMGGGLVCEGSGDVGGSTSMEFMNFEVPNIWYEGQDVYGFLELNKKMYGMSEFLVYYEITNKADDTKQRRATSFKTDDVFGCNAVAGVAATDGSAAVVGVAAGQVSHVKIPILLVDATQTSGANYVEGYATYAQGVKFDLTTSYVRFVGNDGVMKSVNIKELSFKSNLASVSKFDCNEKQTVGAPEPLSNFCDSASTDPFKIFQDSLVYGTLILNENVPGYLEILTKNDKDEYATLFKIPVQTPSSISKQGQYKVDVKIYSCTGSLSGECGVIDSKSDFNVDSNNFRAIIGDSVEDAGQMKSGNYNINKRTSGKECEGQKYLIMLKPLDKTYITPNYNAIFFPYNLCDGEVELSYKKNNRDSGYINKTGKKIDDKAYKGAYQSTIDLIKPESFQGTYALQSGQEIDVSFAYRYTDTDNKIKTTQAIPATLKISDSADLNCIVPGLSG